MKTVNEAGTATIEADSGGISETLNIPVGITLLLADPPNIDYSLNEPYYVSFDIDIQGAELLLEEMRVSWDPSSSDETLNVIEIDPNSTENIVIYPAGTSDPISSEELIDVIDNTLSTGTSNVKIHFNQDVSGKTITVIFNPNSGNYSVPVPVPET